MDGQDLGKRSTGGLHPAVDGQDLGLHPAVDGQDLGLVGGCILQWINKT